MQKDKCTPEDKPTPATLLGQELKKTMDGHMARLDQEILEAEAFIRRLRDKTNQPSKSK